MVFLSHPGPDYPKGASQWLLDLLEAHEKKDARKVLILFCTCTLLFKYISKENICNLYAYSLSK